MDAYNEFVMVTEDFITNSDDNLRNTSYCVQSQYGASGVDLSAIEKATFIVVLGPDGECEEDYYYEM